MSISFKNVSFSLRTNSMVSLFPINLRYSKIAICDQIYVNYTLSNFIVSSIYLPNTNNLSYSLGIELLSGTNLSIVE